MAFGYMIRHKSTLSIILKRELRDCAPSREVPVLYVKRSRLFGGDLEINLGGSIHPVRLLPVSGKDVRNLRFGLVYGPQRKRIRFRAPDLATYTHWEMILELAVEKAAAERPYLSSLLGPRKLSVGEEFSDDFGFSEKDNCDEAEVHDSPIVPPQIMMQHDCPRASGMYFIHSSFIGETFDENVARISLVESDDGAPIMPLAQEVEVVRPTLCSISDKLSDINDVQPSLPLSRIKCSSKLTELDATTVCVSKNRLVKDYLTLLQDKIDQEERYKWRKF